MIIYVHLFREHFSSARQKLYKVAVPWYEGRYQGIPGLRGSCFSGKVFFQISFATVVSWYRGGGVMLWASHYCLAPYRKTLRRTRPRRVYYRSCQNRHEMFRLLFYTSLNYSGLWENYKLNVQYVNSNTHYQNCNARSNIHMWTLNRMKFIAIIWAMEALISLNHKFNKKF